MSACNRTAPWKWPSGYPILINKRGVTRSWLVAPVVPHVLPFSSNGTWTTPNTTSPDPSSTSNQATTTLTTSLQMACMSTCSQLVQTPNSTPPTVLTSEAPEQRLLQECILHLSGTSDAGGATATNIIYELRLHAVSGSMASSTYM